MHRHQVDKLVIIGTVVKTISKVIMHGFNILTIQSYTVYITNKSCAFICLLALGKGFKTNTCTSLYTNLCIMYSELLIKKTDITNSELLLTHYELLIKENQYMYNNYI